VAPSTSDADSQAPRRVSVACNTPYSTVDEPLVPRLLDELERIGFHPAPHWAWSYHNYNDFEQNQLRVLSLRAALADRWPGRSLDGGPALFCTEGGCRLTRVIARFGLPDNTDRAVILKLQAQVIDEAVRRHHVTKNEGAGVAMLTQYTTYADQNFDSGLLDTNGTQRPSLATWSNLTERPLVA
jgi:hypothetical protein